MESKARKTSFHCTGGDAIRLSGQLEFEKFHKLAYIWYGCQAQATKPATGFQPSQKCQKLGNGQSKFDF